MNSVIGTVSAWLFEKRIIIELTLAGLVVFACLLKFINFPYGNTCVEITMQALAAFYFLSAFVYRPSDQIVKVCIMLFSINSAISVIGILFTITHLPGAKEQLMIGLIGLALSALAIIFLAITGRRESIIPIFIRLIILGGLTLNAFMGLNNPSL